MSELPSICSYLNGKGITIPQNNEWLNSCVQCFKAQALGRGLSQLQSFVYEQWLLADLRDVKAGTLPNCANSEKFIMTGRHAVQFNFAVNVAVSFHKQLQMIRCPDSQINLEFDSDVTKKEPTGRRSLKFELTDGITTLIGFEDEPILSVKQPVPGEKAVLTGPIEVRKGCLMLKGSNVRVLGGEVDTLLIVNAAENILARALNMPENPNPYKQLEKASNQAFSELDDDDDNEALLLLADAVEKEISQPTVTESTSRILTNPPMISNQRTKQTTITGFLTQGKTDSGSDTTSGLSMLEDDFVFPDDDFDYMSGQVTIQSNKRAAPSSTDNFSKQSKINVPNVRRDVERESKKMVLSKSTTQFLQNTKELHTINNRPINLGCSSSSSNGIEYTDLCDSKQLKEVLEKSYSNIDLKSNVLLHNISSSHNLECRTSVSSRNISLDECGPTAESEWIPLPQESSLEIPRPAHEKGKVVVDLSDKSFNLDNFKKEQDTFPQNSKQVPVSTDNLNLDEPYPPKTYPCIMEVQGKVVKLSQKLGLKDEKWSLSAIVSVKGFEMEMDFSSETLDKIFGISGKELTAKRKEVKTNPLIKEQMNALLKTSQLRIKNLNCKMVLKFTNFISNPLIMDVFDL